MIVKISPVTGPLWRTMTPTAPSPKVKVIEPPLQPVTFTPH